MNVIPRRLPLFSSLGGYDRAWLRSDLIAGLTVWAVLVPEALAYASIAGVSPVVGLYAAPGALLLYAAFGSSRHLVTGPMSATAALSAAAVAEVATKGGASFAAHTTALAITTGLLALAAGLLRLGFLASFISEPVLKGFIIGLALGIIAGQLADLLGIPAGDGDFFAQAGHLVAHLGDTNPWTAAVGLGSLAVLLGLKRVAPAAPAALGVVVAGIAAVALFDLAGRGVEVIGQVDGAVPLPAIPSVGWDELAGLFAGAAAVAIIGYAESATVAESMANEHGYIVEPDRELRAIGAANILSGLFQGFITGGGASQSAANDRAGANTQLVSLLVSGLTVVTAVALLPLFRDLPQAALAAVVISAVIGFLNLAALARVRRLRRDSFVIALVSLAAVLTLGVLQGLILGVVISVGAFLVHSSRPSSTVRAEPGLLVYRLNAPLLFVNAKRLRDGIRDGVRGAGSPVRVVLLDLSFTPGLDIESVNVLGSLRHELAGQGIALWLGGVHAKVAGMLDRSGLTDEIGQDRVYRDVEDAVADASA